MKREKQNNKDEMQNKKSENSIDIKTNNIKKTPIVNDLSWIAKAQVLIRMNPLTRNQRMKLKLFPT